MGEHRVVTSKFITTLVVSLRAMEVNQGQVQTQYVKRYVSSPWPFDVSAARSSYAKDREHSSSGRSPGSWLQTLLCLPSHSIQNGGWLSLSGEERTSCSPVTVARETAPDLHRLPYSAGINRSWPPNENNCSVIRFPAFSIGDGLYSVK